MSSVRQSRRIRKLTWKAAAAIRSKPKKATESKKATDSEYESDQSDSQKTQEKNSEKLAPKSNAKLTTTNSGTPKQQQAPVIQVKQGLEKDNRDIRLSKKMKTQNKVGGAKRLGMKTKSAYGIQRDKDEIDIHQLASQWSSKDEQKLDQILWQLNIEDAKEPSVPKSNTGYQYEPFQSVAGPHFGTRTTTQQAGPFCVCFRAIHYVILYNFSPNTVAGESISTTWCLLSADHGMYTTSKHSGLSTGILPSSTDPISCKSNSYLVQWTNASTHG